LWTASIARKASEEVSCPGRLSTPMPKKVATKHGETHASFCLIFTPQPLAARGIVMALTGGRAGVRVAGRDFC